MNLSQKSEQFTNNPIDKNGLYCAYLRKSRDDLELEKVGEHDVLERHRKSLMDLAKRLGITIEKFYEEVISGDSIDSRPEMCTLLHDVDSGMWDGVLVMEVERLARGDTIDQGRVARSFQYSDTLIITPMKIYNPNDEYDEEYFEFGLFMSRREYKTIKRRMQRGRVRSVHDGKYVGNVAPYGYRRIRIPEDTGFTLEPVPEEAAVVKTIFDLYVYGLPNSSVRFGMQRIADYLNEHGVKPMRSDSWSCATIKTVLTNPVYCGYVRWNSRKSVKHISDGKITISRPVNHDCDICKGLHEPIITEELFQKAAEIRSSNPSIPVGTQHSQKNPFAGLIFCSVCGAPMQRKPYNISGKECVFICPTRGCPTVSDYLDNVEKEVLKTLQNIASDYRYNAKPDPSTRNAVDDKQSLINIKKSELQELYTQQDKLFDFLERGVYTEDIFKMRMKKITQAIQDVSDNLATLEQEYEALSIHLSEEMDFIPKCELLIATYNKLSPVEKNMLLKELIEKIIYTKSQKNPRGKLNDVLFRLDIYPKIKPSQNG